MSIWEQFDVQKDILLVSGCSIHTAGVPQGDDIPQGDDVAAGAPQGGDITVRCGEELRRRRTLPPSVLDKAFKGEL